MRSFRLLPVPLLALLFALPVLSEPTTPNDPFHHISALARKEPELPICCLRPLSPLEDTEEEVVLSFEEWKAKQAAGSDKSRPPVLGPQGPNPASQDSTADVVSETYPAVDASVGAGPTPAPFDPAEVDAPLFKIPITDRFNYASSDCSARVHAAHKTAKSASSILSSKKDRYMLSPCAANNQFVAVELCDDIRIDTVQLANYEFFSGVFKDFSVYVSKRYTSDPSAWTFAGTYRAENVRGVQSFHPPRTLSDFYRFIRIEFHSHYGNEYYCPVSLLRVYGLTHLEHWKWEQWEAESQARRALEIVPVSHPEIVVESTTTSLSWEDLPEPPKRGDHFAPSEVVSNEEHSTTSTPAQTLSDSSVHESMQEITAPSTSDSMSSILSTERTVAEPATPPSLSTQNTLSTSTSPDIGTDANNDASRQLNTDSSLYTTTSSSESRTTRTVSLSDSVPSSSISSSSSSSHLQSGSPQSISSVSTSNQSSQATRSVSTPVATVIQSVTVLPPASAPASGGESIYRTIMNRLTALESNSSLYARFVEDHAASVREMLRRLSEDVGRLEGIGRAQAQMYQRSVGQFERQQRRLEVEHSELISQVSRLTDEVILEKRLGIAQLCLLLAVLVFMAFTRGSRSEPLPGRQGSERVHSRTPSFVGWGQRTLNISGDWVNKLRQRSLSPSSSTAPTETPAKASVDPATLAVKVDFPSQDVQSGDAFPRSKRPHPITGGHRKVGSTTRPRTPQSARAHPFRHSSPSHPATPTSSASAAAVLTTRAGPPARPPIQRAHSSLIAQSFSTGGIGPVPKSARRWARTAHLHEVKSAAPTLGASRSEGARSRQPSTSDDDHADTGPTLARHADVFSPRPESPPAQPAPSPGVRGGLGLVDLDVANEADGWVDTDAESDSEHIRS
ncbi:UNC-like C-terminal-domain-containing protein [Phanerochaete sordida]|uniref:UNC-like C-terminal-domain-containing protein n=1 Tax=Phanerochaete sordida TaxID=48140 RepID=A0A9P3GBA8_9APHY|nr:UNC-like C-terminal-domain-containing protein [Phanerochaete sordida]